MSQENDKPKFDWSWIRERLSSLWGRDYWKSIEQLADSPEFTQHLADEFPESARPLPDAMTRRDFLKFMGASLMLAGLGGCTRQPTEKIVPYVKMPEYIIPGKPLYFATAMPFGRSAQGLLIESQMGRPTKAEGNPGHPENLGATGLFAQASLLDLYDPDRAQVIKNMNSISTWELFILAMSKLLEESRAKQGEGLRILTQTVNSPTLQAQFAELLQKFPKAVWHQYEPVNDDAARKGAELAFGENVNAFYKVENANVLVALDSDFLSSGPGSVRYIREFSRRRRSAQNGKPEQMNRLYAVESALTGTGAIADHRLPATASEILELTIALAEELGIATTRKAAGLEQPQRQWIKILAQDLKANAGKSLVVAGEFQAPEVHALAHAINEKLGNAGKTVIYTQPLAPSAESQTESIMKLSKDMADGKVDLLFVLGGNPVFDAPADANFSQAYQKVKQRIFLGSHENETSELSHWHVHEAHYLETWGDARAYEGTVSFIQPLIAPLYNGRSIYEMMAVILGKPGVSGYDMVRDYWKNQNSLITNFEDFWKKSLNDGFVKGTDFAPKAVTLQSFALPAASRKGMEIDFRPDPGVWDGRFANNAWLQELPRPITQITWDNALLISPADAEKFELNTGDVVELRRKNFSLQAPVYIQPGHASGSGTLYFGHGRRIAGKVGTGTGFNAYPFRASDGFFTASGVEIAKTGKTYHLVTTQDHHSMEGRDLVRTIDVEDYKRNPNGHHEGHTQPSLYEPYKYETYAWGMAIDLSSCTGCNACVAACQSENNIPVVGKNEVSRGREMHWLRIDRYYSGSLNNPKVAHQPVLCMHCENAPCEPVCPVGATTHSKEGLNEMTYNRCVGTKYCSNNCPYKVRRFNFFEYSDGNLHEESLKLMQNPDVTVRSRGVMEKCTYCVQRINQARIQARREDRKIKDGEVVTACQQSCAAEAIVFGDINDPASKVSKLKAMPLNYGLLTDLNTNPRTSYLARLRNPNPQIEALNL